MKLRRIIGNGSGLLKELAVRIQIPRRPVASDRQLPIDKILLVAARQVEIELVGSRLHLSLQFSRRKLRAMGLLDV
jgi:hypothetical protein